MNFLAEAKARGVIGRPFLLLAMSIVIIYGNEPLCQCDLDNWQWPVMTGT
jgi:hypothetical protein